MKICKNFEFPAIKNWDKYSHLLEKKLADSPSLVKTSHVTFNIQSVCFITG